MHRSVNVNKLCKTNQIQGLYCLVKSNFDFDLFNLTQTFCKYIFFPYKWTYLTCKTCFSFLTGFLPWKTEYLKTRPGDLSPNVATPFDDVTKDSPSNGRRTNIDVCEKVVVHISAKGGLRFSCDRLWKRTGSDLSSREETTNYIQRFNLAWDQAGLYVRHQP